MTQLAGLAASQVFRSGLPSLVENGHGIHRRMSTPRPGEEGRRDAAAIRQGVSVGLATGAYGISFGALSIVSGLNLWQTCLLSLLMFTGGSQGEFNRSMQHRVVEASVAALRTPRRVSSSRGSCVAGC